MQKSSKTTITITFAEQVENHVGMEKIGKIAERGFNLSEMVNALYELRKLGVECNIYNLGLLLTPEEKDETYIPAYILVAKNAVDYLLKDIGKNSNDMLKEELSYEWDSTMFSRKHKDNGKQGVVQKNARHNVCYADISQKPDIANGKGTLVNFKDVPLIQHIREKLPTLLGEYARDLLAEGNKYYDISKCYIGWHGDSERRKIVGTRVGQPFPLLYNWFSRFKPVGKRFRVILNNGDLYVMSDKAVGSDWKKSSILTLRHAAGFEDTISSKTKIMTDIDDLDSLIIPFDDLSEEDKMTRFCENMNINNLLTLKPETILFLYKTAKTAKHVNKGNRKIIKKILKIYKENIFHKKTIFGYK